MTGTRGLAAAVIAAAVVAVGAPSAHAIPGYRSIAGSGSTWAANVIEEWITDAATFGLPVSYDQAGSGAGRSAFANGTVDFAVSEIPYGLPDAAGPAVSPPDRGFAYLPIVAGGTAFAYNLTIDGQQVTNLRLSGEAIAGIFTGTITTWGDPAIQQDNPNLALPERTIVPVVRSDASGTTAQFTAWLSQQHTAAWNGFCSQQEISFSGTCLATSFFPRAQGFNAQAGSLGVTGFVDNNEDGIAYVEYSSAVAAGLPVVKLQNEAGFFVEPTAAAVGVALTEARVNDDQNDPAYLTQILDDVYTADDPRAYPLSSYSYAIVPTEETSAFAADKGRTLAAFLQYGLCTGQQKASALGYSPLPLTLVEAGFDQIRSIPGSEVGDFDAAACDNPTFGPDGTNLLLENAPQPPACDAPGQVQCVTGTGGAPQDTPISREPDPTDDPTTTEPTDSTSSSSSGSTTSGSSSTSEPSSTDGSTATSSTGATTGTTAVTAPTTTRPPIPTAIPAGGGLLGGPGSSRAVLVGAAGVGLLVIALGVAARRRRDGTHQA